MTIIFYDIPSTRPGNAWSPNTWKTRYCLNFKGIPYKTEWIEYPDIEEHCKKFGILETSKNTDGRPHYTLPAIHDPSTGVYLADSFLIAEYLEKTYPTPSLFPHNTLGLQTPFNDTYGGQMDALWNFILPATCLVLNPPSEEYFRRTREKLFGTTLEDLVPKGENAVVEWAKYKDGLGKVDTWYAKSGGPFLIGDAVSWADFVVAAYLIWLRIIWGEDSQQWKDITSWHQGRWKILIDNLKKYETIV
ncbi:hypothetical protein BDZ97DRAFT_1810125 [Flammula alnicola]|nr:hypothetical protein BDZ97DRAFT_1810125 [Flammula alnicola]